MRVSQATLRAACGRLMRPVCTASRVAVCLALAAVAAAQHPAGSSASPDEMALGDAAYRERRDAARAEEALRHYRAAFAQRPNDAQAAWRVGMASYYMGMRGATKSALQQRYWAEGRDAARRGTELDPTCAPCHFWTAINMALYGESVGVLKMLFTLRPIRKHLERSIELDPHYAYGGANRVLGLIDRKLPAILGGSKKRARAHFEAAIAASPDEPLNYLFLAQLLLADLNDRQGAIAAARQGLNVPALPAERVEAIDCMADIRAFLTKLGVAPQ